MDERRVSAMTKKSASPFACLFNTRSVGHIALPGGVSEARVVQGRLNGRALTLFARYFMRQAAHVGQWWVLVGLLTVMSSTGCGKRIRTVLTPPSQPLAIRSVVIYPLKLIGTSASEARVAELSHRIVLAAVETHGADFDYFGPLEFFVRDWDSVNPWTGSNALPLLTARGNRPDQGLVLRLLAEQRVTSAQKQAFDAAGRAKGGMKEAVITWVVTAELVHPTTRAILAELSQEVTVDPFEKTPASAEFDPDFALIEWLARLTEKALEVAVTFQDPQRPASTATRVAVSTTPKSLPLPEGVDALQAEVVLANRARFLNPALDEPAALRLVQLEAGLRVESAQAGTQLQPGDLILSIDGQPAQLSQFTRLQHSSTGGQLSVKSVAGNTHLVIFP